MSIKAKGIPAWYVNQPLVLSSHFQGIALATFGGSLYIPSLSSLTTSAVEHVGKCISVQITENGRISHS